MDSGTPTPPSHLLENRLLNLEASLAHLERLHEELNGVVTDQARDLARLQLQLRRITDTVAATEVDRILATNPKPPHSA